MDFVTLSAPTLILFGVGIILTIYLIAWIAVGTYCAWINWINR